MRYRLTILADLIVSSESEVEGPSGTPEASRFCSSLVTAMGKHSGARPGNEDDLVGVPGCQKVDVPTSCAPVRDLLHDRSSESKDQGCSGIPDALELRRSLVADMAKHPGAQPGNEDDLVGVPGCQKVDVPTSCAPVRDLPHDRSSESEDQGRSGTPDALKLRRSLVADMAKHPGAQPGNEDDLVGVPGCQKVDEPASCAPVQDLPHYQSSENRPDRPGTPDAMKLRRSLIANMAKHQQLLKTNH